MANLAIFSKYHKMAAHEKSFTDLIISSENMDAIERIMEQGLDNSKNDTIEELCAQLDVDQIENLRIVMFEKAVGYLESEYNECFGPIENRTPGQIPRKLKLKLRRNKTDKAERMASDICDMYLYLNKPTTQNENRAFPRSILSDSSFVPTIPDTAKPTEPPTPDYRSIDLDTRLVKLTTRVADLERENKEYKKELNTIRKELHDMNNLVSTHIKLCTCRTISNGQNEANQVNSGSKTSVSVCETNRAPVDLGMNQNNAMHRRALSESSIARDITLDLSDQHPCETEMAESRINTSSKISDGKSAPVKAQPGPCINTTNGHSLRPLNKNVLNAST
ncbi:unnamed protein product, partial [Owenia fusiformis]